jgi:hypothetical protein
MIQSPKEEEKKSGGGAGTLYQMMTGGNKGGEGANLNRSIKEKRQDFELNQ